MARDYDSQLLESVAVRRRRLRDAVVFGGQRSRRSLDEGVGKVFGGIALAAVVCAGCVGWSFVSGKLADKEKERRESPRVVVTASAGVGDRAGSAGGAGARW
ncbi:hypothetical protein [Streptomyces sp. NPDC057702]|uniref:hypothetical protein n=1 Tax=unclassified Streptomyces TaxID=2593676 RepID=UPI00367BD9F9